MCPSGICFSLPITTHFPAVPVGTSSKNPWLQRLVLFLVAQEFTFHPLMQNPYHFFFAPIALFLCRLLG